MTMTRQHFALIAETIAGFGHYDEEHAEQDARTRSDLAYEFVRALRATNPNFNRDRFLRACGVSDA